MGDFEFDGRTLNIATDDGAHRFPALVYPTQDGPVRHVYVPCENGLHVAVSWQKGSMSSNYCTVAGSAMAERPFTVELYGVWVHGNRRLLRCTCQDQSGYQRHDAWGYGFTKASRVVELINALSRLPTGDDCYLPCSRPGIIGHW